MRTPAAAWLEIDLGALGRNFDHLKNLSRGAEVAPVLKADAYGIGSAVHTPITDYLVGQKAVETVFVATFAEATSLRVMSGLSGQRLSVYALNGYAGEPRQPAGWEAVPVLCSRQQAAAWTTSGGGRCALALDIGMNRLGVSGDDAGALPAECGLDPDTVDLIVMHLSHGGRPAAEETRAQAARFGSHRAALKARYPKARFSLSNSGGLIEALDAEQQVVRPGYALFGGSPDGDPDRALEPVATFTAPVIMERSIAVGETAGYDGRWRAERPSRLAILGAGYADGYPRSLTNRGAVSLGGALCPVVGAVSMDLMTVDITDAPDPIGPLSRAELFGAQVPLDEVAARAGTIGYELLTGIGNRVERIYAEAASQS